MQIFLIVAVVLFLSTTCSKKARAKNVKPTVGRFFNVLLGVLAFFVLARITIGWFVDR